mmetsp:Transcript_24889/g.68942  ORF Transcript_24889/g.68942 Transcript_24889/m.68942 type:complete len:212 (+) Transcript_24889:3889-4524(+)
MALVAVEFDECFNDGIVPNGMEIQSMMFLVNAAAAATPMIVAKRTTTLCSFGKARPVLHVNCNIVSTSIRFARYMQGLMNVSNEMSDKHQGNFELVGIVVVVVTTNFARQELLRIIDNGSCDAHVIHAVSAWCKAALGSPIVPQRVVRAVAVVAVATGGWQLIVLNIDKMELSRPMILLRISRFIRPVGNESHWTARFVTKRVHYRILAAH